MTERGALAGLDLKPLIYGLAFEAGLAHPETLIEDRPARFGVYVPKNFDQDWHGTVTIRMALAQSLNIPAVKVLDAVGPAKLFGRLRPGRRRAGAAQGRRADAGDRARRPRPQALAISPALYAGLARGGEPVALHVSARRHRAPSPRRRARGCCRRWPPGTSPTSCATRRRRPTPSPAQIAYKTGTSYGFRDAWAVGYDGRHTIAVWVGRPDGAATPGPGRPHRRRAAAVRCLRPPRRRAARRCRRRPPARSHVAGSDLPPPLKRFREARDEQHAGRLSWSPPCRSPSRPTAPSSMSRMATAPASSSRPRAGPAADLARRRRADRIRSRQARGRAAGGRPRLPQALGDRRQGPRRPRHDPAEVAALRAGPGLY